MTGGKVLRSGGGACCTGRMADLTIQFTDGQRQILEAAARREGIDGHGEAIVQFAVRAAIESLTGQPAVLSPQLLNVLMEALGPVGEEVTLQELGLQPSYLPMPGQRGPALAVVPDDQSR